MEQLSVDINQVPWLDQYGWNQLDLEVGVSLSQLDQYGGDHLDSEFTRWRVESESVGTRYLKWNGVPEME